jgi:hypothetical protein
MNVGRMSQNLPQEVVMHSEDSCATLNEMYEEMGVVLTPYRLLYTVGEDQEDQEEHEITTREVYVKGSDYGLQVKDPVFFGGSPNFTGYVIERSDLFGHGKVRITGAYSLRR